MKTYDLTKEQWKIYEHSKAVCNILELMVKYHYPSEAVEQQSIKSLNLARKFWSSVRESHPEIDMTADWTLIPDQQILRVKENIK